MVKMVKPTRGILLGTVALVLVAGGVAGGYYLGKKRTTSQNYSAAQQAINKPPEQTPSGTITPSTLIRNSKDYIGKEQKVYGFIIEISPNKYLLSGQEVKNPAAINLDFTESKIDPKPYINNQKNSDPEHAKPNLTPVTVVGTLVQDASGARFNVKSVDK
jgi:hypothetical protein